MPKSSSSQDAVRAKAQQMRQEQARKDRRTTIAIISVVTVLVLAISAAVAVVISQQVAKDRAAREVDPASVFGTYASGEPVVYSSNGIGSANDSVPTLTVYFDYSCHVCADVDVLFGKELADGAKQGDYNIAYQSVYTVAMEYQKAATSASLVVAQHAPDQWLDYHHALMAYFQSQYNAQTGSVVNDADASFEKVKEIAAQVGVDQSVIDTFPVGAVSDSYLQASTVAWQDAGIEGRAVRPDGSPSFGTPEFVSNGKVITLAGATAQELLESVRAGLGL